MGKEIVADDQALLRHGKKKERKRKEEGTQNKSGWERKEKAGGTTYYEWESIREKELQKLSRVLKRIMESGKKTLNCIKPNWAKTNLWEENGKDSLKIKNCFKLLTLLDFFWERTKVSAKDLFSFRFGCIYKLLEICLLYFTYRIWIHAFKTDCCFTYFAP